MGDVKGEALERHFDFVYPGIWQKGAFILEDLEWIYKFRIHLNQERSGESRRIDGVRLLSADAEHRRENSWVWFRFRRFDDEIHLGNKDSSKRRRWGKAAKANEIRRVVIL